MRAYRIFGLAIAMLIAPLGASAANYYWTGDETSNGGNDGFNFDFVTNYSINNDPDPNVEPTELPNSDDVLFWAYGTPTKSIFIPGTNGATPAENNRDLGALVVEPANNSTATFPFINNSQGITPRPSVTLHGAPVDHRSILKSTDPFSGDITITSNTVLRAAYPNTVLAFNAQSGTFGGGIDVKLAGGGMKAVHSQGGVQGRIQGALLETTAGTGLEKWGGDSFRIDGAFGLTGDIKLRLGTLTLQTGFDTPGKLLITNVDGADGSFKRFNLNTSQTYKFTGVTINEGAVSPVIVPEGTYTAAQLNALATGAAASIFTGSGTLIVGPAAPSILAGDYNNDMTVNAADYTVWRDANNTPTTIPNDTTPGNVSDADYTVWKNNFNMVKPPSVAAASAVPEPASLLLVSLAVGGLFALRRASV